MKYGFITVAAAIPGVRVADTDYNVKQIENLIAQAEGKAQPSADKHAFMGKKPLGNDTAAGQKAAQQQKTTHGRVLRRS